MDRLLGGAHRRRGRHTGARRVRVPVLLGVLNAADAEADDVLQEDGGAGAVADPDPRAPGLEESEPLVPEDTCHCAVLRRWNCGGVSGRAVAAARWARLRILIR